MIDNSNNGEMKKQLTPLGVWAIAFGCVIGMGAFVNPGEKFLPDSGTAGTAIAMILGAVVMMIFTFSYMYMVPKFPETGGGFAFAKNCWSKPWACFCGWFLIAGYISEIPMNATALGLAVDGLDDNANILKFGFHYQVAGCDVYLGEILAISFILLLFGVLNIVGVKKASAIQNFLAALLVMSVLVLTVAAIFSDKSHIENIRPLWGFDKNAALAAGASGNQLALYSKGGSMGVLSAILATFAITPWAYVGFDTIPQCTEELNFSVRKVSFIMGVSIVFGAFVYITTNTTAAIVLENWPQAVMDGEWVLLIAAEKLLGKPGVVLLGVAVISAVLSSIMGFYLVTSRLMFAMARSGYLPKRFDRINIKFGTPVNAMIFCIIIALAGPFLGRKALGWFVDMSSIGISIVYFFTCSSAFREMKHDGDGNLFLKAMAIAGSAFAILFVIIQLIPLPGLEGVHFCKQSYIMLLVWCILGILFYAPKLRNTSKK